ESSPLSAPGHGREAADAEPMLLLIHIRMAVDPRLKLVLVRILGAPPGIAEPLERRPHLLCGQVGRLAPRDWPSGRVEKDQEFPVEEHGGDGLAREVPVVPVLLEPDTVRADREDEALPLSALGQLPARIPTTVITAIASH